MVTVSFEKGYWHIHLLVASGDLSLSENILKLCYTLIYTIRLLRDCFGEAVVSVTEGRRHW